MKALIKKRKIKYTEGPVLYGKRVEDFLPRPEDLVFRPASVKITLSLDINTLHFFKTQAKKLNAPYQRMIRNLLDEYVARVQK